MTPSDKPGTAVVVTTASRTTYVIPVGYVDAQGNVTYRPMVFTAEVAG